MGRNASKADATRYKNLGKNSRRVRFRAEAGSGAEEVWARKCLGPGGRFRVKRVLDSEDKPCEFALTKA